MAKYVDGFVLVVPKQNIEQYKQMALEAGKLWKKHGALQYFECVGEDLAPKMEGVEFLKFPKLTMAGSDDTVVFSFIVYNSRQHRDEVNAKVMQDSSMEQYKDKPMPFDVAKMAYGGFETLVSL